MHEHKVDYCDHCQMTIVICGKCGNNTCNGGYGEVIGPEPGTTVPCDACPSAYTVWAELSLLDPNGLDNDH